MLKDLQKLVWVEKRITKDILEKLQYVYDKKFFEGYTNLFQYMVEGLGYSEATASLRQNCLKLIKEIPELAEKIEDGSLNYTTLGRSYKFIKNMPTKEKQATLSTLENKSSRQALQELEKHSSAPALKVKERHYQDRVHINLSISHEQFEKLKRIKALRSHKCHTMEELITTLITEEEIRLTKTNFKQSKSKNPRQISQTLKNHLLKLANYRCQHPKCKQDHFLQIDHIKGVSEGGCNRLENLQVLCAYHNREKYISSKPKYF